MNENIHQSSMLPTQNPASRHQLHRFGIRLTPRNWRDKTRLPVLSIGPRSFPAESRLPGPELAPRNERALSKRDPQYF